MRVQVLAVDQSILEPVRLLTTPSTEYRPFESIFYPSNARGTICAALFNKNSTRGLTLPEHPRIAH